MWNLSSGRGKVNERSEEERISDTLYLLCHEGWRLVASQSSLCTT